MSCGRDYPEVGDVPQVVFDLDKTLAEGVWPQRLIIGAPIPEAIAMLKHYSEMGVGIVIYTSRPKTDEPHIWAWVLKHKLPVDKVVCGKPIASYYIDDKAITWRTEDWKDVPETSGT